MDIKQTNKRKGRHVDLTGPYGNYTHPTMINNPLVSINYLYNYII